MITPQKSSTTRTGPGKGSLCPAGYRRPGCTSALPSPARLTGRRRAAGPGDADTNGRWFPVTNRGKFVAAGRAPRRAPAAPGPDRPRRCSRSRAAATRWGLCSCQRMPEENPQPPRRPCCCRRREGTAALPPGELPASPAATGGTPGGRIAPFTLSRIRGGGAGAAVPSLPPPPRTAAPRSPAARRRRRRLHPGLEPRATPAGSGHRSDTGSPAPHAAGLLSPRSPTVSRRDGLDLHPHGGTGSARLGSALHPSVRLGPAPRRGRTPSASMPLQAG